MQTDVQQELDAMNKVFTALQGLEPEVQERVLVWATKVLNIDSGLRGAAYPDQPRIGPEAVGGHEAEHDAGSILDGVNIVARKWITRSGLDPAKLATVFSLGGPEVDLVANAVPGDSKKDRMRSVFLLRGIAAYLATGAARFTHEQLKEACLHYDAFDSSNFALYFKSLVSEVSGNKESGYTLTPRGLANATEMIRHLSHV